MSVPLPPVPAEDFALPLPTSHPEPGGTIRRSTKSRHKEAPLRVPLARLARHTLGIVLLLVTVVLWTASNFLASTIFADDTYSKPYFVTYVNSSFFFVFLVIVPARRLWASGGSIRRAFREHHQPTDYSRIEEDENEALVKPDEEISAGPSSGSPSSRLIVDDHMTSSGIKETAVETRLNFRETARLSFEFCMLWFLANYFVAACLEYTTVASSTILSSTSSIFTLIIGGFLNVERFTVRKLIGVLASLAGIILISSVDLTGNNDKNRGSFPHKTHKQLAIGDALALASALLYGIYTTVMKKKIGDESRVDMALFFGFVGLFNLVTLLPGFPILHYTGIETFEIPPTKRITAIILINSATSLVADFCWAYSMLLTSPLVVTVGLSLTIPLSLFGQMILNSQTSSATYWVGACIVLLSFVFINYESKEEEVEVPSQHSSNSTEEAHGSDFRAFFQRTWDRISQQRDR